MEEFKKMVQVGVKSPTHVCISFFFFFPQRASLEQALYSCMN